jgi:hypothetical protein
LQVIYQTHNSTAFGYAPSCYWLLSRRKNKLPIGGEMVMLLPVTKPP